MNLINTYTLEVKKSKFIAYFYELDSKEEVDTIIETLWKENKKARHIPYAYIYKGFAKKTDDKEPNGTAGTPLYNALLSENLDHHLIAVVRYFGGIKLGAGPLLRAYNSSAFKAIKKD